MKKYRIIEVNRKGIIHWEIQRGINLFFFTLWISMYFRLFRKLNSLPTNRDAMLIKEHSYSSRIPNRFLAVSKFNRLTQDEDLCYRGFDIQMVDFSGDKYYISLKNKSTYRGLFHKEYNCIAYKNLQDLQNDLDTQVSYKKIIKQHP